MLVLMIRRGEWVDIDNGRIKVRLAEGQFPPGGKIRLAIDAPHEVRVKIGHSHGDDSHAAAIPAE